MASVKDVIDRLREALANGTPGPWYATRATPSFDGLCSRRTAPDEDGETVDTHRDEKRWTVSRARDEGGWNTDGGYPGYGICLHDAELIAAAVNALPALLKVAEAAERVLEQEDEPDMTELEVALSALASGASDE